MARAIASESGVAFLSLHSAALESKWYGDSPKLLQSAFRMARTTLAPCIMFFDEIDGLGRSRSESDQQCVYSFKCELLRNLDGVDTDATAPLVVMACTNNLNSLDPALRRRFQCVVEVPRPDATSRFDILKVLTRDEGKVDKELLLRIARETDGFTGADLAALFSSASRHRANTEDMRRLIGTVQSGEDLLQRLGPLTYEHWNATGKLKPVSTASKTPE